MVRDHACGECPQSAILYKSVELSDSPDTLAEFRNLFRKHSDKRGYCSKELFSMTEMSNANHCDGGSSTNIGYYYKVYFSTFGKSSFDFRLPGMNSFGGFFLLDGDVIAVCSDE